MHGRLKVRTTAEQQEAKRKEREKKLKLYTAGTEKVFKKRKEGEYDREGLEVSGQLLAANPDFYTLWNYRKECFLHLKETDPEDTFQELCDDELGFLQSCLRVNPKSYGTWEHRCWIMDHTPKPDWQHELKLCNKCLELDERNFHCWDYRRFMVKRSNTPLEDELKFTTDKISTNFSNFSSWHYRSKLLPLIHPDPYHPVGIKEDILFQEYELAQNAFFTDPNDQSAWFYHRWLLGKSQEQLNIKLLHVSRNRKVPLVMVSLTKVVKIGKNCQFRLKVNSEKLETKWRTPNGYDYGKVWMCELDREMLPNNDDHDVQVKLMSPDGSKTIDTWNCVLDKDKMETEYTSNFKAGKLFRSELSSCASSTLQEQLDQCQQLHELEPDNKWVMLTIIALTRALDPIKHADDTFNFLDKLKEVDAMRSNYYNDLKSKYVIENTLETTPKNDMDNTSLQGKNLTALYHLEHFVTTKFLNLCNNQIQTLKGCVMLQCMKSLNVDNNRISSCDGLESLDCLEELSIKNNCIGDIESLAVLASCDALRVLHIEGNPITSNPDYKKLIKGLIPQLTTVD